MTKKMTPADASRIQSVTAIKNNGVVDKDSFAAKAQRITSQRQTPQTNGASAPKKAPQKPANWPSKNPDMPSGKKRDNAERQQ
jgi:hypothetical protein